MGLTLEILGSLGQKGLASSLGSLGLISQQLPGAVLPLRVGTTDCPPEPGSAFSSTDSRHFPEGSFFNLLASSNKID